MIWVIEHGFMFGPIREGNRVFDLGLVPPPGPTDKHAYGHGRAL